VSCKQWDVFYNIIWTYFERKQDIFQKKELLLKPLAESLPELTLIYEETNLDNKKEYDYPLKHVFKITDEYYEFSDITAKKIKKNKNLTQEGLILGKKKNGVIPDIYFDSHIKTVSGKQFQITAKKYANAKGYYISDLSTTNFTALKVEAKPYALSNNMIFDINGHIFEVLKVTPEPTNDNHKGYFLVQTSGMEKSGESLIETAIKLTNNRRKSVLPPKTEEIKKNDGSDDDDDKTLKRKPKVNYALNKQATPSIVIQCHEGTLAGAQPIELKAKSNKAVYVAGIGSEKDNEFLINDPEGILPYNGQIVFVPEWNCWVIAEKWAGSKQIDFSAGTLIYLKTAEDYKKGQAAGFACKLRNEMKIFFNCHVLSVNLKEA